jgi:hypothetical protein
MGRVKAFYFEDIQIEEDPQYLQYEAEQEYRQWLQSRSIDDINAELAIIAAEENELNAVDFI